MPSSHQSSLRDFALLRPQNPGIEMPAHMHLSLRDKEYMFSDDYRRNELKINCNDITLSGFLPQIGTGMIMGNTLSDVCPLETTGWLILLRRHRMNALHSNRTYKMISPERIT